MPTHCAESLQRFGDPSNLLEVALTQVLCDSEPDQQTSKIRLHVRRRSRRPGLQEACPESRRCPSCIVETWAPKRRACTYPSGFYLGLPQHCRAAMPADGERVARALHVRRRRAPWFGYDTRGGFFAGWNHLLLHYLGSARTMRAIAACVVLSPFFPPVDAVHVKFASFSKTLRKCMLNC